MPSKKPKTKRQPSSGVVVDKDAQARLAYELYLRRGGEHGYDVEDWLKAERLLLDESRQPQGRRSPTSLLRRRLEDKFGAR